MHRSRSGRLLPAASLIALSCCLVRPSRAGDGPLPSAVDLRPSLERWGLGPRLPGPAGGPGRFTQLFY